MPIETNVSESSTVGPFSLYLASKSHFPWPLNQRQSKRIDQRYTTQAYCRFQTLWPRMPFAATSPNPFSRGRIKSDNSKNCLLYRNDLGIKNIHPRWSRVNKLFGCLPCCYLMLIDKPMLQSKACKLDDAIWALRWICGFMEKNINSTIRFRDRVGTTWKR